MKKGFTLVEVMATIIILSVLALIIVPIVSNVVGKSKFKLAVESVKNYVSAANNASSFYQIDAEKGIRVDERKYIYESGTDDLTNIKTSGAEPTYTYMVYDYDTRTVSEGHFCINGYSIDYTLGEATKSNTNYCEGYKMNIGAPTMTYENEPSSSYNGYFKKQTINVHYDSFGVASNYVMTTRDAKVVGCSYECNSNLDSCISTCVANMEANKWYKATENLRVIYDVAASEDASITAKTYFQDEMKGQISSEIGKIDTTAPTVDMTVIGATVTIEATDTQAGVAGFCVTKVSEECEWQENTTGHIVWTATEIGDYEAYVKDGVGNVSDVEEFSVTDLTSTYPATASCTNGGTYDGNGGCYYASNNSICGCATWKNCSNSACGKDKDVYNTCENADACGTDTVCGTCTKPYWQYCCWDNSHMQGSNSNCTTASTGQGKCPSDGHGWVIDPSNSSRCYASAKRCDYTVDYTNDCNKCGSTTVAKSCQTSACGVAYTVYNSCRTSECGCETAKSCTKSEPAYLVYSCPDGGTLEGAVCKK